MSRPSQAPLGAILVLLAFAGATAYGQTKPQPKPAAPGNEAQKNYEACLSQVRANPQAALGNAEKWARAGGGAPADHCAGLALVEMGKLADGAERLETAAARASRPDLAADLLDQAGNVWLMQGSLNKAYTAFSRSLQQRPDQVRVLVDRARALGAQDQWEEARADLDRALMLAPSDAEARVLRAGAKRRLNDLAGARADADAALAATPGDPDALLERGNIRHLSKDDAGARADWAGVLKRVATGPTADAARANLEALDVKGE
jgi:regulator of sirC expression with transglutaminase-like and TPR domain